MSFRERDTKVLSLDGLWDSAPPAGPPFRPSQIHGFPEPARRYLKHAIASNTPLAAAARLRMHGEIKLRRWFPFEAEQVIRCDGEMIWSATVRMHGLPIRGFDRPVNREGAMRWTLLGILPIMTASGPDITRSAVGRVAAESVWLPSVFCGDDVSWTTSDLFHPSAHIEVQGQATVIDLTISDHGRSEAVKLTRWGNPEGTHFHEVGFGAVVEKEDTYAGYTIPTRLRAGWHLRDRRFEADGEFFRVTIDDATYR